MKAEIKRDDLGTFLTLTPTNKKERDELRKLWHRIPEIRFIKRGSISGEIPIRMHKFTIEIVLEDKVERKEDCI